MHMKKMSKIFVMLLGVLLVACMSAAINTQTVSAEEARPILDITPQFSPDSITANIGDSGRIQVLPIHGIEVTGGKFTFGTSAESNAVVNVFEDGSWVIVGIGRESVNILYEYSQETLRKLADTYPGYDLAVRDIANVITFEVFEVPYVPGNPAVDITPIMSTYSIDAKIGEAGRIQVLPVQGIPVTGGTFKFYTTPESDGIVALQEDGRWTAVGAGKVSIGIYYDYSQETLRQLADKFPGHDLVRNLLGYMITFNISNDKVPQDSIRTNISGDVHLQTRGWISINGSGSVFGTTDQARRLEAFSLRINQLPTPGPEGALPPALTGNIEYRSHVQSSGWESVWRRNGEISGTTGQAKRLEAIQIRLTGELSNKYDIRYRVHVQGAGWLPYAQNGEMAGTVGQGRRLEAIQIYLDMRR